MNIVFPYEIEISFFLFLIKADHLILSFRNVNLELYFARLDDPDTKEYSISYISWRRLIIQNWVVILNSLASKSI